ncbi:putative metal-dependent peptidase [Palleronia aestuarii]|uniref:Putative metal-dependent peptidase n=1 Tax=Palleronia aestuarii TaxID=568105 RepID=A0A2W7N336_9RHOB|nr:VWA-like domain-containing protein [Palleronia aestuarii]PZX14478.1 putative metal-dependent peptidase [Palleronia aestuarii]
MIHARRAGTALAQLGEVDPGLASLALWCRHRDDPGPTRTRGETILYAPGFDTLPLARQVGLAAHHVLHIALRHAPRQEAFAERIGPGFDAELYNLAADAIVNETLSLAGHVVPPPAVTLADLLAAIGEDAADPGAALAAWDVERLALRLHRDERSRKGAKEYGDRKAFARDLEGGDAGEGAQSPAEWHGHIERAAEIGRRAGHGFGALGAAIADTGPPSLPWELHLRRLMARALSESPRQTWRRPASRWVALHGARDRTGPEPVFEPGRQRSNWQPRIVIGLDTSSSIEAHMLALFVAEAGLVARRMAAETHVLAFDEAVHTTRKLTPGQVGEIARMSMRTGGGTSYLDLLARSEALSPSVLVILTDLDGPAGVPPRFPVIWVAPRDAPDPPFGTLLRLDT